MHVPEGVGARELRAGLEDGAVRAGVWEGGEEEGEGEGVSWGEVEEESEV